MKIWIPRILLFILIVIAGRAILSKHVSRDLEGNIKVSSDVLAYVKAGGELLAGNNLYYNQDGTKNSYVYPPFYAMVNIPLTFIHPLAVDIFWFALNVCLLVFIIRISYNVFTGQSFSSLSRGSQWVLAGTSILLTARYLVRNFQDANVNLLILFFIVLSVYHLSKGGSHWWATLLGIAGAIKVAPLIFGLWLLARRDWKSLACVTGAFVAATLAPALFTGPSLLVEYLNTFFQYTQSQFSPTGIRIENFSIWGTLGRLFSHNVAFIQDNGTEAFVNFADVHLSVLRFLVYAFNIGLLIFVYTVVRNEVHSQKSQPPMNYGFALTLLAMNLISILTEDHHTVSFLVVYVLLLVVRKEMSYKKAWFTGLLAGTGALSILVSYDVWAQIFGKEEYQVMLSYSIPVLPVGLVLLGMVVYVGLKGKNSVMGMKPITE